MAKPETLAAFKRAYADTILNTTKEAAARVMVSENKAHRYQQELVTVRDEALHMLLRLKQMFDSKVKETEVIFLKQQQKVEELEAQLGEAEDIVGELRMELRELHNELKKFTSGQTHRNSYHEEDSCWKNRDAVASVVPEVSCSDERSGAVDSCIPFEQNGSVVANGLTSINRCSYKDNKDQCHLALPSILKKRREAEGCTQMIHAADRVMASGELSSSVQVGNVNYGVCLHKVPSCKSAETLELSGCGDASDSISSVRDGEDRMVSLDSSQKDFGSPLKTSTSEHENERKSVIGETEAMKEEKKSCENMEVSAFPLCEETSGLAVNNNRYIKYTFKRKRKKEVIGNLKGDSSVNMKQKTGEKDDGYLESLKNESSWDSMTVAQLARQTLWSVIGETEAMKEEKKSCENMEVSAFPLCEETSGLAVNNNRYIKYTFKRKRKKEVIGNLKGDSSVNMKQKTGEKDDGYLESLKNESSWDSMTVAQLARQTLWSVIGETEAMKEEKKSCENMEVSAFPLCEETSGLAVNNNRYIKYTFKRKRKKEVIGNLKGDSSVNMKQKTGEKDDGYLESLKNESSWDSMTVAQLARQTLWSVIGETEAMKEEKKSCENMEVSAFPLCEETSGLAVNNNRYIKYTFKRKRKKEVIGNLKGDSSVNMKQKTGEKDDGYLESLKNESSWDSMTVAQLALQLVPLSERKGLLQSKLTSRMFS